MFLLFLPHIIWAFWAFNLLSWSELFHRENRKAKQGNFPLPLFFFLSSCPFSPLYLSLQNKTFFISTPPLFHIHPYRHINFPFIQDKIRTSCEKGLFLFCDLMMSKKMKRVSLESTPSHAVGLYEDARARDRTKHQSLLQDYQELQKESNGMRNKLQSAKQRRQILAAEVRFLRKRREYLLETKFLNSSLEKKDQIFSRKDKIPQVPDSKPKRKHIGKEAAAGSALPVTNIVRKQKLRGKKEDSERAFTPNSDMNNRGRINIRKENLMRNTPLVIDLNERERISCGVNDTGLRNSATAFDLNQDSNGKEARLPSRAPIFDLNEISTGDEDFPSNNESFELDDARKGFIRGLHDEQHSDLKFSVCRNAGESSTRVGKRKISWQDPVALRV